MTVGSTIARGLYQMPGCQHTQVHAMQRVSARLALTLAVAILPALPLHAQGPLEPVRQLYNQGRYDQAISGSGEARDGRLVRRRQPPARPVLPGTIQEEQGRWRPGGGSRRAARGAPGAAVPGRPVRLPRRPRRAALPPGIVRPRRRDVQDGPRFRPGPRAGRGRADLRLVGDGARPPGAVRREPITGTETTGPSATERSSS